MAGVATVQAIVFGLLTGVNYAIFATGLTLVFGVMFVVNMSHGELFMLGAVIVWALMKFVHMNYFFAVFVAIVLVAAFGFVLNRVAVRPLLSRPPWLILIATLGISMILLQGTIGIVGRTGLSIRSPFSGYTNIGGLTIAKDRIMVLCVASVSIVALYILIKATKLGKDMRATIQSPVGAALCGINTDRVYDFVLIIASGMAALGGAFTVPLFTADELIGQSMLLKGFAITVAAGMGNLAGALILGVVFGVIESLFSQFVDPYFKDSFIFGIMIIVLLVKPQGLFTRRTE